jgi:hypothetical protein
MGNNGLKMSEKNKREKRQVRIVRHMAEIRIQHLQKKVEALLLE